MYKRQPLLYAGLSGVTVSLFALGASFWFANALGDNLKWMAVGSVVVYIASFAFSLGPIGWIVVSEILPLKIRGLAMSICTVANMAFNFVVVLTFLPLINSVGEARTFWMYAGADRKELGRRRPCPQVLRIPLFKGSVPGTFFIFGRTVLC